MGLMRPSPSLGPRGPSGWSRGRPWCLWHVGNGRPLRGALALLAAAELSDQPFILAERALRGACTAHALGCRPMELGCSWGASALLAAVGCQERFIFLAERALPCQCASQGIGCRPMEEVCRQWP